MGWVDKPTAISALRSLIFDGPTDKYCALKKVFGVIDGTNASFKTFEYRRVTDFTTAVAPQGVFVNGLPTTFITTDDTATGTFTFTAGHLPSPATRDVVTASYYYQWYLDSELDTFLQNASTWLGASTDYSKIVDGLNAAALRFAAQEAYEMAAMRYSTRMSEVYKLEDAPDETILKSIDAFRQMADSFMDKARDLRNDYWTRQGQSLAPNFGFNLGTIRDPVPRR